MDISKLLFYQKSEKKLQKIVKKVFKIIVS